MYWVNIQNGKVVQCRDTDPQDPQWVGAVEIKPALGVGQYYGDHYFDITKTPVEIVWPVLNFSAEEVAIKTREQKKATRTAAVEAITVTTAAGNTFQGDETSQTRMARAIIALQATGTPSVNWVLADNTAIQATAAELVEALALSGAAQAAVWVL